jgi:hypothetical protein
MVFAAPVALQPDCIYPHLFQLLHRAVQIIIRGQAIRNGRQIATDAGYGHHNALGGKFPGDLKTDVAGTAVDQGNLGP